MYMEDLVRPEILRKVEQQLDQLDVEAIFDSGGVEQLLECHTYSPFPQLQMTFAPSCVDQNI